MEQSLNLKEKYIVIIKKIRENPLNQRYPRSIKKEVMKNFTIAVTGKGGVGKTTVSGLIVSRLIALGKTPVLAVDADPNTCLDEVLGVKAEVSIGGVREEARKIASKGLSVGISKQELLEMKIAESLVEADDFDLMAMGRPEGAGCYCFANNVLKQAIGTIAENYPFVMLDNEAGLENLSRRIVHEVDILILVADPSKRGLDTAKRLHEMTEEMDIKYHKLVLLVNRMRKDEVASYVEEVKTAINADLILALPDDEELAEIAENGKSIFEVSDENKVVQKIDKFIKNNV